MDKRPSRQLKRFLSGDHEGVSDAVKSWARLHIHRQAVKILSMPKPQRKAAIDSSANAELVRVEVVRVFNMGIGK